MPASSGATPGKAAQWAVTTSGQLAPLALAPHKEAEGRFFPSVCITEEPPLWSEFTGSVDTPPPGEGGLSGLYPACLAQKVLPSKGMGGGWGGKGLF